MRPNTCLPILRHGLKFDNLIKFQAKMLETVDDLVVVGESPQLSPRHTGKAMEESNWTLRLQTFIICTNVSFHIPCLIKKWYPKQCTMIPFIYNFENHSLNSKLEALLSTQYQNLKSFIEAWLQQNANWHCRMAELKRNAGLFKLGSKLNVEYT